MVTPSACPAGKPVIKADADKGCAVSKPKQRVQAHLGSPVVRLWTKQEDRIKRPVLLCNPKVCWKWTSQSEDFKEIVGYIT
eukprot:1146356-Pelagomonas_calceolata.AAC.2